MRDSQLLLDVPGPDVQFRVPLPGRFPCRSEATCVTYPRSVPRVKPGRNPGVSQLGTAPGTTQSTGLSSW
ncbi:hypothetical protein ACFPRL_14495 [Pseudoclavibacter helvolus]